MISIAGGGFPDKPPARHNFPGENSPIPGSTPDVFARYKKSDNDISALPGSDVTHLVQAIQPRGKFYMKIPIKYLPFHRNISEICLP